MVGTNSFPSGSSFVINNPNFKPNRELRSEVQIPVGIRSQVNDRISIGDPQNLAGNDVLSPLRSVEQSPTSSIRDDESRYLEVAFSPQDQINNDIVNQVGYFNLGDYIGSVSSVSSDDNKYTDFDTLRDSYFRKYTKSYDLVDFVRLIKFFDNSLFRMIKDFSPSNVTLTSGVVVKQHLLERNKQRRTLVSTTNETLTGSVGQVETFSGGPGGSMNRYQDNIPKFDLTQSWSEIVQTLEGPITKSHSDEFEFYNGEFPSPDLMSYSSIDAIDGNGGSDCSRFTNPTFEDSRVTPVFLSTNNFTEEEFLERTTVPNRGIIWLWHDGTAVQHIKVSTKTRTGLDITRELALATEVPILLNNPSSTPLPNLTPEKSGFYSWVVLDKKIYNDHVYYSPNIPLSPNIVYSEDANIFDIDFDSTGDLIWYASASGNPINPLRLSGIYESIPQGYFPTTPTYPQELFIRGWNGSNYLIEPNEYITTTGTVNDNVGLFDIGNREVSNAITSSDESVYGRLAPTPTEPWFMNAPQATVTYTETTIVDLDPAAARTVTLVAVILTPRISGCPTLNNNQNAFTVAVRFEGNESLFALTPAGYVLAEGVNGTAFTKDIDLYDINDPSAVWNARSITTPSTVTTVLPDGNYGVNRTSAQNNDNIIVQVGSSTGNVSIEVISYCP